MSIEHTGGCDQPEDRFSLIADDDARAILAAAAAEPVTVPELVDRCGVPTSTAYRKTRRLVDAGLLEEGIEERESGKNPSEYVSRIMEFVVDLHDAEEFDCDCSRLGDDPPRDEPLTAPRMETTDFEDGHQRRLRSIFLDVTGTDRCTDTQRIEPTNRILEDEDLLESIDDGLGDAIDALDAD